MATKIYELYSPRAVAPSENYPYGSIQNESLPGADDGTPLEKVWGNNIEGFLQALLIAGGVIPNGSADTVINSQLLSALRNVIRNGEFVIGTGTANTCVITVDSSVTAYSAGQVFRFKAVASNTGATTLNVNGIGAINLYGLAGVALQGGEILAGSECVVMINSSATAAVLLSATGGSRQIVDATKSHHALALGQFNGSIGGSSGWKKQPFLDAADGVVKQLTEQWGVATVSVTSSAGGTFAVTLPITFTTAIHHISANLRSNASFNDNVSAYAYPTSLGTITLVLDAPGVTPFPTGTYYIYWRVQGV